MPFEVERHNYQPSKPQVQFFLGNSPVCFSFYLFFLPYSVPRNFHMATRNLNRFSFNVKLSSQIETKKKKK